ncbi:MAG: 50S ribosomal protein L11 methyltransferase [Actinomycetota bacterium]|nr:50S ribosomal protein L11 methyltransferase [Actinomycetota bacterium]
MQKVDIAVSHEAVEALSAALLSISPSGIQIEDKNGVSVLTIYTSDSQPAKDTEVAIRDALQRIRSHGLEISPASITIKHLPDKDWVESVKKHFKPIKVGKLLIQPTWETKPNLSSELVIRLDPGLAFGTGSHPTTEGCLLSLQEVIKGSEIVFDIGTGSGILAIAAAKLGAKKVIAIDNDKLAIAVAKENALINHMTEKIDFTIKDFTEIDTIQADVVVANLTAPAISNLLPIIKEKIMGMKVFIASGITIKQRKKLIEVLREKGFRIEKVITKGEWITIVSKLV